jgi:6-phosphofructokinase
LDNDLAITDSSPGFGSAAKYVATSLREAAFDLVAMSRTSTNVFILEVMGRQAGWMTAACARLPLNMKAMLRTSCCEEVDAIEATIAAAGHLDLESRRACHRRCAQ